MTRRAITQIVEAFFRRWPVYAALFLGCIGVGVVLASNSTDGYTSSGSVFVDSQSLVADSTGVRETGRYSYLSPAQFTSQELSGLVRTEVFIEAALQRAGAELDADPVLRRSQIDQLRASVSSSANSENLVRIDVTTPDPELSFRVADGVIEEFVQFKIDLDVTESGASERFFADLVDSYEADLTVARSAVEAALRGVADLEQLSPERQLQVERLQADEQLAEDRYTDALANLEASKLATLQTETDVRQRYSVFDPPVIPVEPNSSLLGGIIVILGFAALGAGLALTGPLLSAALNRTIIFPEDLEVHAPGHAVVAIVPRVDKRETRLAGIAIPEGSESMPDSAVELGNRTITFVPESDDAMADMPDPTAKANERPPFRPSPPGSDQANKKVTTAAATTITAPAKDAKPPKPPTTEVPSGPPAAPPADATPPAAPSPAPAAPGPPPAASPEPAVAAPSASAGDADVIESNGVSVVETGATPPSGHGGSAPPAPPVAAPADDAMSDEMRGLLETTELGDHVLPNPPPRSGDGFMSPPEKAGRATGEENRG